MLLSKVQIHYPFDLALDFIFKYGMSVPNYKKEISFSGQNEFEKVISSYSSVASLLSCSHW
jgi:hypothetical protein